VFVIDNQADVQERREASRRTDAFCWSAMVPEYRIYELDDQGNLSKRPSIGIWKDDVDAQTNARTLLGNRAHEIWCGERKVATIKPGA
jgi:hypothetical protein